MSELVTPFLSLHSYSDADVRVVLGRQDPTRREVSVLELVVAARLLEQAGFRVKIRKEAPGGDS